MLFTAGPDQASAGVNTWTSNGPPGGQILALAIDSKTSPSTVYAATFGGGVFESANGGPTTVVYAGTCTGGAFVLQQVAPTVTAVNPNSGPNADNTPVTISGTNFASGATVTFGGAAATSVTVVDAMTIMATPPAHAVGAADVVVTNPTLLAGTLPAASLSRPRRER